MNIITISAAVLTGGQSQKIATSTTSAQSAAIAATAAAQSGAPVKVLITPDATCFARYDANPTALSDGTDQILLANNTYRVEVMPGGKFAFILATGTGNVYVTPGA